jgi:chromosomal replication initiation ATPase DnaA
MHDAGQIALPLSMRKGGSAARIVVGDANARAVEALQASADWPYRTAILAGPPRSGKTMLANWFAAREMGDVVDDAHMQDETQLFHRWNRAQEAGRALLLTVPAGGWDIALPDLKSRLGAALHL